MLSTENKSTRHVLHKLTWTGQSHIMNTLLQVLLHPLVISVAYYSHSFGSDLTDNRPKVWEWGTWEKGWCIRLGNALPLKVRAQIWSWVVPCPRQTATTNITISQGWALHTSSSSRLTHTGIIDYSSWHLHTGLKRTSSPQANVHSIWHYIVNRSSAKTSICPQMNMNSKHWCSSTLLILQKNRLDHCMLSVTFLSNHLACG